MDTERDEPQRPDDPDLFGVPQPHGDAPNPGNPRRQPPGVRETGPLGTHETSGIEVRLGTRDSYGDAGRPGRPGPRQRGPRRAPDPRTGRPRTWEPRRQGRIRRGGAVAAVVAAGAVAAVLIAAFLVPGMGEDEVAPEPQTEGGATSATGPMPPTGTPIEVATTDGSTYRIAVVTGGLDDRAAGSRRPSAPAGTSFAYVDYVLSNPSGQPALLDYPGDLFVPRELVAQQARGRCVWQPGVPEAMCTPPVKSAIVRRLAGDDLKTGDGGDRYLQPGSAFLVRAMAEVPVSDQTKRGDLRLYVWKQLYMADQLAKQAPFPR